MASRQQSGQRKRGAPCARPSPLLQPLPHGQQRAADRAGGEDGDERRRRRREEARGREADGGRATARMDPPRWAADRGRRRRIHEGEGLLISSRERIDGGWGRIHDGQDGGRAKEAAAAATTRRAGGDGLDRGAGTAAAAATLPKKKMGLGGLDGLPPPGGKKISRGRRSGDR